MFSLPSLQLPAWSGAPSGAGMQAIGVWAGRVVVAVLLIVCFYYISSLFWRVFYPEGFRPFVPVMSDAAVTRVAAARGRWEWFADTAKVKPAKPPPSRLDAKLIGVIAQSRQSGKGFAVIKYKGKDEIYRVGDEIDDAVVLREIASAYVTLQHGDRTETLEIEKITAGRSGDGKSRGSPRAVSAPSRAVSAPPGAMATAREFKQLLRKEPMQLLNLFEFARVEEGGKQGFSLSPKRDDGREMMSSLGLEPGDVLLGVNGAPAARVPSNPRLWKALLKANKIRLKVLRGGAEKEISIQ